MQWMRLVVLLLAPPIEKISLFGLRARSLRPVSIKPTILDGFDFLPLCFRHGTILGGKSAILLHLVHLL